MIKSLKYRILGLFIGALAVIIIVFSVNLYYIVEDNINIEIKDNLSTQALYIEKNILNNSEDYFLLNVDIAILKNNKIIKSSNGFYIDDVEFFINQKESFFLLEDILDKEDALFVKKFDKPYNGAILILSKDIHEPANKIKNILYIMNPILLILISLIAIKLVNKVFIAINNVTQAAKNTSISNFEASISKPDDNKEIYELVKSFNEMIKRLQEETSRLDRFNSDVSHELKTPLTVIKGEIEITLRKNRDENYYKRTLKTIGYETKQLENIVENLLILTRYSKENIKKTFVTCNLDAILFDIVDKYTKELEEKNIHVDFEYIKSISLHANSVLIRSIFSNLLENAIKYSDHDTKINVKLFEDEDINFIIKDEGIGINKEEQKHIFDRFYRVEKSRNKKIKGFGLGLTIVENSVNLHNGSLHLRSKENKGTIVHIKFPKV